jgi:DivIVA domain-containing protein
MNADQSTVCTEPTKSGSDVLRTDDRNKGEVMPLTPEDVSNKRFTPVRLREGYDMGEVDQFLDEVEAELSRLTRENDDLRSKLSAAQQNGGAAAVSEPTQDRKAAPAATELPKVTTVADASSAAARLLEIATRNADELVTEAKGEADKVVGEARTKAERLEAEAKSKSERMEEDARTRSQMLDAETAERRQQLLGDLEKEKGQLNTEVANLRAFEREYRSRLKNYFQQQLAALDGNGEGGETLSGNDHAPGRLKSLLGEDSEQKG